MGWVDHATLRPLYPRERPGTQCIGGWVDPRDVLGGCGKCRSHSDSIPGPSLYRLSYPTHGIKLLAVACGGFNYEFCETVCIVVWHRAYGLRSDCNLTVSEHFIIQPTHNIQYVDTIKIMRYLKVLQNVSDNRGSIIREPCTVFG